MIAEAFARLPLPPVRLQVNSRKLIEGYYLGAGVASEQVADVMRVVDKIDKVSADTVVAMLTDEVGLSTEQARTCVALTEVTADGDELAGKVKALGVQHPMLDEGVDELARVLMGAARLRSDRFSVVADLRIARGLDYYTGTVYETRMQGFEHVGLDLLGRPLRRAGQRRAHDLPGSRHLARCDPGRRATAQPRAADGVPLHADLRARRAARRGVAPSLEVVATALRSRGIPAEVSPSAAKYGKQIRYAERRGIPYVWFPQDEAQPPGPGHPLRRAGRRRSAGVGPAGGGPAPVRLRLRRPLTDRQLDRCEGLPLIRTNTAGSLRASHAGQTVTLAGWVARRRDHGGVAFIDLRDASGFVQVVIRDETVAAGLRSEYCLRIEGEVSRRPEGNANPNLPTGEVEVVAKDVEVLSESAPLPFQIDEHVEVGEEVRLKHRYLDLRRPAPAAALRLRSKVNQAAREVLHGRDFVEVETPTLTRSTPEGARDFLVPARLSRAAGTRCRSRRSCSSSCSWSPAWSATSRSPAATATRTSGPTGSRSSPSSTSR